MFTEALPKFTERRWLQQLIGAVQRDGRRRGGLLRMLGWHVFHDESINAPRRCPKCREEIDLPRSEAGWPDLVLVRGQVLWFVELKSDRGKPTEAQQSWLDALRAVTAVRVAVWRPRDIDRITEVMR